MGLAAAIGATVKAIAAGKALLVKPGRVRLLRFDAGPKENPGKMHSRQNKQFKGKPTANTYLQYKKNPVPERSAKAHTPRGGCSRFCWWVFHSSGESTQASWNQARKGSQSRDG